MIENFFQSDSELVLFCLPIGSFPFSYMSFYIFKFTQGGSDGFTLIHLLGVDSIAIEVTVVFMLFA